MHIAILPRPLCMGSEECGPSGEVSTVESRSTARIRTDGLVIFSEGVADLGDSVSSMEGAYETIRQPSMPSIHAMLRLGYSGDLWCAFNVCSAKLERAELAALPLPSHGDMNFYRGGADVTC